MNTVIPVDERVENEAEGNIRELVRRGNVPVRYADDDGDRTTERLNTLLHRVSGASTRQLDRLIDELQILREKLHSDCNRVQRDITKYAALSQSVMQLTKIISESVRKLPGEPDDGA